MRLALPPTKPLVVKAATLPPEVLGTCVRRRERFVTRLYRALMDTEAIRTLLHDWTNELAWRFTLDRLAKATETTWEALEAASHDVAWGVLIRGCGRNT